MAATESPHPTTSQRHRARSSDGGIAAGEGRQTPFAISHPVIPGFPGNPSCTQCGRSELAEEWVAGTGPAMTRKQR